MNRLPLPTPAAGRPRVLERAMPRPTRPCPGSRRSGPDCGLPITEDEKLCPCCEDLELQWRSKRWAEEKREKRARRAIA